MGVGMMAVVGPGAAGPALDLLSSRDVPEWAPAPSPPAPAPLVCPDVIQPDEPLAQTAHPARPEQTHIQRDRNHGPAGEP